MCLMVAEQTISSCVVYHKSFFTLLMLGTVPPRLQQLLRYNESVHIVPTSAFHHLQL